MMRALVLVGVVLLSGCAAGTPEPQVVYVTQTSAPAPTVQPTYLKVNLVFNQVGESLMVQMQAFSLNAQGEPSYSGYSIRSVAVSSAETNRPVQGDWPLCNERMEGLRIKVFEGEGNGGEIADRLWNGIHCTGEESQYVFTILENRDVRFGAYTGNPSPPPRAPEISFSKDSSAKTLTVVQAPANAKWDVLEFSGSCAENGFVVDNSGYGSGMNSPLRGPASAITLDDVISGCTAGETLSIVHWATGSQVYSTTF